MDEPVRPGPARVVPIREPVQLLAERWRELSQRWAQQHAPTTSYGRLCRCAELEVSDVERSHIRKDIRRSRPDFFCTYAPEDLDLTFHAAKLERVLCAWAVYDIEIGYVQAMNLLGSTLLMLLEGDEEAAFWVLVTLLRQLPHEFYSRAPLQLLGFWVEVEVLVQLADRLLGLRGLRGALLQITPRWLLEFWVGTLPLGSLLLVWDHLLRYAPTQGTPSTFNLQVALALLELLQPQVSRHLSERMDDVQAVYSRLAGMRLPDGDGSWLLQSALDIDLNDTTVQEMRLQLRIGLLHRCRQSALLPCMRPLPHVCVRMPVLRKQSNRRPLQRVLTGPCRRAARVRADNVGAPAAAALLMLGVFAASCVLNASCASQRPPRAHMHAHVYTQEHRALTHRAATHQLALGPILRWWALSRIDSLAMLLVLAIGAAVSARIRSWRRTMSTSAACCSMYVLAKTFAVLALGRSLRAETCGDDCCNWVYCPCMRWWWLAVQGSAMSVAAAVQIASLCRVRPQHVDVTSSPGSSM